MAGLEMLSHHLSEAVEVEESCMLTLSRSLPVNFHHLRLDVRVSL